MNYSFYKKVDIPLIFTVLLWGFIWLLWLPYRPIISNGTIHYNMSVSLYQSSHPSRSFIMDPLIFEAKPQLQTTEETVDILSLGSIPAPTLLPNPLERSEIPIKDYSPPSSLHSFMESLQKYTPVSTTPAESSSAPESTVPPINVHIEGELAARGFEIPYFPEEIKQARSSNYQISLSVKIGNTGRPDAVFVIHSSGDTTLDLLIVKTILKGRSTKSGPPCEGTITITHR